MVAFLCALINIAIIIFCFLRKKSIFYPVCLLNLMWLAVNILNVILGWNSGKAAYLILALPPLCFSVGFYITDRTRLLRKAWNFLTKDIGSKEPDEEDETDTPEAPSILQRVRDLWRKVEAFFPEKVTPFFNGLDEKGRTLLDTRIKPALKIKSSGKKQRPVHSGGMEPWLFNGLLAAVCIVFVCYSCEFLFRLGQYSDGNIWLAFRNVAWDYGVNDMFVYKYASVVVFLLPSLLLASAQRSKNRKDYIKFFVSLAVAVIWSILRTSRTSTFTVVILLAMSQITLMESQNPKKLSQKDRASIRRKKLLIFAAAVVFMVAIFLYVALKKNGSTYGDVSTFMFFLKSLANYTNLSSAAFVEWYEQGFFYTCGSNSFRFIIAVLYKLGIIATMPAANSGGQYVAFGGLKTNALTVARAYVEDFGVLYMAIMLTVFGMIHGAVHKKARVSEGLRKVRYALISGMLHIPLFFQILTNQYLNVLSGWIQYVFWICLFTAAVFWTAPARKKKDLQIPMMKNSNPEATF